MAKKKPKTFNTSSNTKNKVLAEHLTEEWQKCDQSLEELRTIWDKNEKLFFNADRGDLGDEAKSNVNDGHLSTAIIQRTQRIMAQPATGKVQSLDRKDKGKSLLMSTILEKYIKVNANTQYPHLTKLKLWTIYSQVYGSMPMLVDYVVTDRYTGPDCWLIPIRQWYPQAGKFQARDRDFDFVDSFVTVKWLESRKERGNWRNIDKLLDAVKEKEGKSKSAYAYQSYPETEWGGIDFGGKGKYARILLRTKYERDHWQTYAPDFEEAGIVRDIENPHKNDELPIIVKETIPLLDRTVGLGDMERGAPLQLTANSLLNLYMDTVKYSLFPPTIINKNGVVPSSLKWQPGVFWLETIPNSIREYQHSPQGTQTFNNAMGFVISTLNNMLGTTDLSVSSQVEPTMGKTPQALKMQEVKESAADVWERQSLEEALEQLYDRFVDLMANKTEKPIDLRLFSGEIEKIQAVYPDVTELFESRSFGKITIKPEMIKGAYRFFIDTGSSVAKDNAMEHEALTNIIGLIMKAPGMLQAIRQKGKDIDLGELIKRWIITSGINDADKIVVDAGEQMAPGSVGQMQQQIQTGFDMTQIQDPMIRQAAQQLFGGGQPQGVPMQPPIGGEDESLGGI